MSNRLLRDRVWVRLPCQRPMHLWYSDCTSAFQAEDEGLTPSRCSNALVVEMAYTSVLETDTARFKGSTPFESTNSTFDSLT